MTCVDERGTKAVQTVQGRSILEECCTFDIGKDNFILFIWCALYTMSCVVSLVRVLDPCDGLECFVVLSIRD